MDVIDLTNQCNCCMHRPATRDLREPYTSLGVTEIYSVMFEDCFVIKLAQSVDGKDGICEVCVERLREACQFKTQVQLCQVRLQEGSETESFMQGKEDVILVTDVVSLHEETPILICGDEPQGQFFPPLDEEATTLPCDVAPLYKPFVPLNEETPNLPCDDAPLSILKTQYSIFKTFAPLVEEAPTRPCDDAPLFKPFVPSNEEASTLSCDDAPLFKPFIPLDEDVPIIPCDDSPLDEPIFPLDVEAPILDDDGALNEPLFYEDSLDNSEVSCEIKSQNKRNSPPPPPIPALARKQLAMTCCVRLERLEQSKHFVETPTVTTTKDSPKQTKAYEKYYCYICCNQFISTPVLMQHLKTCKITSQSDYTCRVCNEDFDNNYKLNRHLRFHSAARPFVCQFCNKRFSNPSNLDYHVTTHTGQRPYTCKVCNRKFIHRHKLNRHITQCDTRDKPIKCYECNARFTHRGALKLHNRHVHEKKITTKIDLDQTTKTSMMGGMYGPKINNGLEPFSCEECSNQFTCKAELDRHKRIHTDEKSYECEICETIFFDEISLREHIETHMLGKQ